MRAMILAAGRGERMRPLTDHLPKPLLAAGGKPLIVWHIERLRRAGIREIVINHAHLGDKLVAALGDGSAFDVAIAWSAESPALETAGGIRQALPLLGNAPFMVINGDVFTDCDLLALQGEVGPLCAGQALAHLVLVSNPPHHPAGDFFLDANGQVRADGEPKLTFSGIALYHPDLFKDLEAGQPAQLAPVLRRHMAAAQVRGNRHDGVWLDIGTPERLADLDRKLLSHRGG